MKKCFFFLIAGLLMACQPEGTPSEAADLVLLNGTIYTVNDAQPTAEAVAVKDGKIVFVGESAAANNYVGEQTEVLDLAGKTVTPGLIESHGHIMGLGHAKLNLDLSGVKNYEELVQMVAEAAQKAAPGEWILGRGWHQSKWQPQPDPQVGGFPTHQALSKVSPNNPVWLKHASGHAGFANAKAMEIAGVTANTTFGEEGEILKDAQGQPTGIFNELAQGLISRHIPETTPEREDRALELAIAECLRNGITSFQDAGSSNEDIARYHRFLEEGKLHINLWVMLSGRSHELLESWYAKGPEIDPNGRLTIRAIKLYADGALGSRGAWLLEPYTDRPGHTGHAVMNMDDIEQVAREGLQHGFQVCVHAIGDRANREVLNRFEAAFKDNPQAAEDHRFRIEHAQHLHPDDIPRFAQLGVIASMQGIHMASDRPWAIDRLGEQRIVDGAYVWQKLLQSGAKVINGTDTPVEPVSPIASFYASVTRKTLQGTPEGGYEPAQKMTREQALRSYTLDAAYGAFEEHLKGSIEVGKKADFTVLSQDLMRVPEDQLLNTQVEYTIVDGQLKYQRQQAGQR
ncbi:MAG: amidohydrolase [Bacteroidetes bacterium]|nr:MAG: amidohydrolase [Bacteroidota bacterium]